MISCACSRFLFILSVFTCCNGTTLCGQKLCLCNIPVFWSTCLSGEKRRNILGQQAANEVKVHVRSHEKTDDDDNSNRILFIITELCQHLRKMKGVVSRKLRQLQKERQNDVRHGGPSDFPFRNVAIVSGTESAPEIVCFRRE